MTSAFSVGREAGKARIADAAGNRVTREKWEQNGNLVAHRMYQNEAARKEFMRGFMSAFTAT